MHPYLLGPPATSSKLWYKQPTKGEQKIKPCLGWEMVHRGPGHSPVSLCLIFLVTHIRTVIRTVCSHFSHNHVFQKALAGSDSFLYFLMRGWLSRVKIPCIASFSIHWRCSTLGSLIGCSDCALGFGDALIEDYLFSLYVNCFPSALNFGACGLQSWQISR